MDVSETAKMFSDFFSSAPEAVVTAPGRVNLIGDHIDYNGLPVLPIAIARACRIALKPRADGVVKLVTGDQRFGSREFSFDGPLEPFHAHGDWGNYAKAAASALADRPGIEVGFDGFVESDVPIAVGLSSSSSLVVAVGLSLLRVNNLEISSTEFAQLMAAGERFVGTQGGGMDQAVCLLSEPGHACLVDFEPLQVTTVLIPSHWQFIVASSMVNAEKSGDRQRDYNLRTRQCAEALESVVRAVADDQLISYKDLLDRYEIPELLRIADSVLVSPVLERFRHVVTEAERVALAADAMRANDIVEFGRLMTASHLSLRGDYEVSCPELNQLVEIVLDSGAVGARLTGAGFGGCVVVLAEKDRASSVMVSLQDRFYEARGIDGVATDHVFLADPMGGADIADIV